jgi:hypothetical protein
LKRHLLGLLLPASLVIAWTAPTIADVCNSAGLPGNRVEFNADCAQGGSFGPTSAGLFYSLDNQTSWQRLDMSRLGDPGYDSTYAADLLLPGQGVVHYYVRTSDGANWSTQSPFNAADQWPPSPGLLASTADEPSGDASDPEGPWLDLTGAFVGRSDDYFYAALTNAHTSWPTYTFPQPWYIYSLGFVNPAATSDTWAFALSYANIPGVYTTGLYAINRYANSYERVGNAEAVTSGNRLSLRCPVSTFIGDPRFGPWPNGFGYLTAAANAQAIYPIGGSRMRDTTAGCCFYADRSPRFTVGANSPPVLTNPRVVPTQGTPETGFWFNTRYIDPDTNLPVLHALAVDGETIALRPNHHRYGVGAIFDHTRSGFSPGTHHFNFVFSDGMATVASPRDSFEVIGTGLFESEPGARGRVAVVPNPFRDRVTINWSPPSNPAPHPVTLTVRDAAGRLVFAQVLDHSTAGVLPLTDLPPGVYFVELPGTRPVRLTRAE